MSNQVITTIRTPEDLGIAHLGNPHTAIVPSKRRIDRADYGRRLAHAEGGIFAPSGYFVPNNNKMRRKHHAE